jgi:exodeoxyribonuclease-3
VAEKLDPASTEAQPSWLVATWNVNSLRARHERVLAWLARHRPDVVCLQELKLQEPEFPLLEYQSAGYHALVFGQKTYNGVAILSRHEHGLPEQVVIGLQDDDPDPAARLIAATIPGLGLRVMSVYVPNGQTIDSDKYAYKLRWLERLRAYLDRREQPSEPLLLCGDWNVAPADRDVYDPVGWQDSVICHPQARAGLQTVLDFGLFDSLRQLEPTAPIYTYWDYRMLSFPKNLGLRIDHIFGTESLRGRCLAARVDREARKGEKPSDHAPLLLTLRR